MINQYLGYIVCSIIAVIHG